jgi:alkanesulfonate monooxygenase SsuD/methylene tetrahydromethanopterin reductase-like flavin-dependent oxidoreductase (luciferase family)
MTDSALKPLRAALEAGDCRRAAERARSLRESLHDGTLDPSPFGDCRDAWLRLLNRRGYFVGTPAELAQSLEEIRQLGEGFDLFDLARALASSDAAATSCRNSAIGLLFPELAAFSPGCGCGRHGGNGR